MADGARPFDFSFDYAQDDVAQGDSAQGDIPLDYAQGDIPPGFTRGDRNVRLSVA